MRSRAEIKAIAKPSYKNYMAPLALILLVYIVLSAVTAPIAIFIMPALMVGLSKAFMQTYAGFAPSFGSLFSGFSKYGRNFGAMFLVMLLTSLASMLLVIPGIIVALMYCFTPFILADSSSIGAMAAMKMSKRLTKGVKMKLFVLFLSFIPCLLLCSLPSIISFVLMNIMQSAMLPPIAAMIAMLMSSLLMLMIYWPYFLTALAGFYVEAKEAALMSGAASLDEF